jgi:hypothetical protein
VVVVEGGPRGTAGPDETRPWFEVEVVDRGLSAAGGHGRGGPPAHEVSIQSIARRGHARLRRGRQRQRQRQRIPCLGFVIRREGEVGQCKHQAPSTGKQPPVACRPALKRRGSAELRGGQNNRALGQKDIPIFRTNTATTSCPSRNMNPSKPGVYQMMDIVIWAN